MWTDRTCSVLYFVVPDKYNAEMVIRSSKWNIKYLPEGVIYFRIIIDFPLKGDQYWSTAIDLACYYIN